MSAALAPLESLAALADDTLGALRQRLADAGYLPDLIGACEKLVPFPVDAMRQPLILRMLERRGDRAALFARIFSYDDLVPESDLNAALGEPLAGALLEAGLLARSASPGALGATCRLMPFEDLWLLCDRPEAGADAVMGPGGTTSEFARLLPDRLLGSVLDLGCGAGSLALLAARRGASPVCGTDLNPRAVAMALLNARLNGIAAEFLAGDGYAPVAGRRFARVLSQPPYVIQPPGTPAVTFLHGGEAGDAVSSRVLGGAAAHLEPGAIAMVLLDVPLGGGEPLEQRLRRMVGSAALDLCAIVAAGLPPAVQAAAYAMIEDPHFGDTYARAARRYADHFDATGVREFRHVVVVLRAPVGNAGAALTALLPVHALPRQAGRRADDVLAALRLAAVDDATLLASAVSASPWARFIQERATPVLEEEPDYRVRPEQAGLALDQELSAASLLLLEKLGGAAHVAAAVAAYAAEIEEAPEAVRAAVLEFVRRGLGTGLIVPRG